jgi:hypothetical protein
MVHEGAPNDPGRRSLWQCACHIHATHPYYSYVGKFVLLPGRYVPAELRQYAGAGTGDPYGTVGPKGDVMNVRKTLGMLLAAAALVAGTAGPSQAATTGAVSFAGTVMVTPTLNGSPQTLSFCFFKAVVGCGSLPASTGVAAGADSSGLAVDGLRGTATYVEACGPAGIAPTGTATITAQVHSAVSGEWSNDIVASWDRTGTVALVNGQAFGVSLFIPAGLPSCGTPTPVFVTGAVELAY